MQTKIKIPRPHDKQKLVIESPAKYKFVRAGRRFGKTTLYQNWFVPALLKGLPCALISMSYKDMLQVWRDFENLLTPIIKNKSKSDFRMELMTGGILDFYSGNAIDSIRGKKYAKVGIDEAAQVRDLLHYLVNAILPTMIDFDGELLITSTPLGYNDYRKLEEQIANDSAWEVFHFTSFDNPHIDKAVIEQLMKQMTIKAVQQEIQAQYLDNSDAALWQFENIADNRVNEAPQLRRIVVAIDPAVTSNKHSDETGIVTVGIDRDNHGFVLSDVSGVYTPLQWAQKAVEQFDLWQADRIVGETNNGGDLVEMNLRTVRPSISYEGVHASRGKATRAEPVAALYEQGKVHHVGNLRELETQMITWSPQDDESPDRVDALVWAIVSLGMTKAESWYIS